MSLGLASILPLSLLNVRSVAPEPGKDAIMTAAPVPKMPDCHTSDRVFDGVRKVSDPVEAAAHVRRVKAALDALATRKWDEVASGL